MVSKGRRYFMVRSLAGEFAYPCPSLALPVLLAAVLSLTPSTSRRAVSLRFRRSASRNSASRAEILARASSSCRSRSALGEGASFPRYGTVLAIQPLRPDIGKVFQNRRQMFPDVFLAFLGKPLAELLGIDPNDFSKF